MGFWEQLPYTNFHDLNLSELVKFVNETIKKINEMSNSIEEQNQAIEDFKNYVINYLENLDVEGDVINYINQLISDGVITDEIKTAVNTIGDWSTRNIIYVGDSYGRGRTYPNTYGYSWCDQVDWDLNPDSSYNMSVSGASFSEYNAEANRYGKQLENFVGSHTTDECESITDIIICGGYNEVFNPTSDLVNTTSNYCAKWTSTYIKNNFPNARVFIGFIGRVPVFGGAQATFNNFASAIAKYKEIARKYNWKYLINSEYMPHIYKELTDDGIHFKTSGYLEIGKRIASCLNDGAWIPPQMAGEAIQMVANTSTADNHVICVDSQLDLYIQNTESGLDFFTIDGSAFRVFLNAPTVITTSQRLYLGKYYDIASEIYSRFVSQYAWRLPVDVGFYDSSYNLLGESRMMLFLEPNGEMCLEKLAFETSYSGSVSMIYISLAPFHMGYSNS